MIRHMLISYWTVAYNLFRRIEHAIQRFAAKRKLDSEARTLFDRYLIHGGVKGGVHSLNMC